MTIADAIDAIVQARSKTAVRQAYAAYRDDSAFHQAYFEVLRSAFASDYALAQRLAAGYRRLSARPSQSAGALRVRAVYERLRGDWVKSARASVRAGELASDPHDRPRFALGAVDAYGRAGHLRKSLSLAETLVGSLDAFGLLVDAARVCINAGNAATWVDDHAVAMAWFEQARERLNRDDQPFEWASAVLGESTSRLYVGDSGDAERLAQDAAATFENLGMAPLSLKAHLNVAHAQLRLGRADAAIDLLLRLRETDGAYPEDSLRIEEFLGDAYVRANLWPEAADAFQTALTHPAARQSALNRANAELGLGQAYAALGRATESERAFNAAIRGFRRQRNLLWGAVAVVRKARAIPGSVAPHALSRAVKALEAHRAWPYLAEALLLRARQAGATSKHVADAERAVRRARLLDREWEVHLAYASLAQGNGAIRHFRAMAESIAVARVLSTSKLTRDAFFRDKADAIGRFVWTLLELGTQAGVDEALSAIARFRSAGLVDELLATRSEPLDPDFEARLDALRAELGNSIADGPTGNERLSRLPRDLGGLQRRWNEAAREAIGLTVQAPAAARTQELVYAATPNGIAAFYEGKAYRLDVDLARLTRQLRWVMFEMLSPRLEPDASVCEVERALAELRRTLFDAIPGAAAARTVAPDGPLWQIPWGALCLESAPKLTAVLGRASRTEKPRKTGTVVWYLVTDELPHIRKEIETIVSMNPGATVLSTAREVREWLVHGEAARLHVACHASAHPTNPQFSAFWFEDGPLFASEIARSGLSVDDVVLSACDTGAIGSAYEIDGLTRAFLGRGAKTVVASQWPLHDESAALLMKCLYHEWQNEPNLALALQRARHEVRLQRPHPYYWAALNAYEGLMQ